jgi:hypothetical protein
VHGFIDAVTLPAIVLEVIGHAIAFLTHGSILEEEPYAVQTA